MASKLVSIVVPPINAPYYWRKRWVLTLISVTLMYAVANLAVGGNFNVSLVDPSLGSVRLDIDYIRVYQEKDTV